MNSRTQALLAATLAFAPAVASAQTTTGNTVDVGTTQTVTHDNDHHDFPWGLLGLLGLAGLLGRKHKDDVVHVDRTTTNTDNRM